MLHMKLLDDTSLVKPNIATHAYKRDSSSVIQGNKSTMHRRAKQNKIQSVIQANKIQPVIQANKIQQNKDAPTAHGCSNGTRMLQQNKDAPSFT
ncbi:hypothetical protein F2Q69_00037927 [Brassica cretica]|uniref:Uncharacterized protein n=1 Tax=Brassica cretica TaxID=69181 RepID=A0A8S9S9J5_BRACR|nr:hypothetical protein F2Q69_00037927 [Brassica cretica]